jgi:hypothetical protein
MSTSTSASLASIVSFPGRIRRWDKLEDNENLVKLHAKFWGKSMVQEEVSGQSTSVPGEREDDDTDESIEDDTKTGYVLVLDNKAIPNKRIWVRVSALHWEKLGLYSRTLQADYIRIYDFLVNRWQDNDDRQKYERQRAPSVVITGQPGIGKSLQHRHLTYHKSSSQGRVSGSIMHCVGASLKRGQSSGSTGCNFTCSSKTASMTWAQSI